MSLTMFVYLISVLEVVNKVIKVFFVLNFVVVIDLSLVLGPLVVLTKIRKHFKCYLMTLCTVLFLFIVIPSKSTMYSMLAISVGEDSYKSEIAQKGLELLELKLDELIFDAKKDKIK